MRAKSVGSRLTLDNGIAPCLALRMKTLMRLGQKDGGFALHIILLLIMVMSVINGKSETRPLAQVAAQELLPPAAKRVPKEIVTHSDRRVDDYFWLREKTNAEV